MTTFVFVHGAWHGGADWQVLADRLRAAGHTAVAHDLPGCGADASYPKAYQKQDWPGFATEPSPLAGITLNDWASAVERWIKASSTPDTPVVLVAHSVGGLPATLAADRVPDQVTRLVYLAAHCVAARPTGMAYFSRPENREGLTGKLRLGDPAVTGAIRINPRHPEPGYQELLRQCFYGDLPVSLAAEHIATLSTDLPVRVVADEARGDVDRWGRIPRTFIRCREDRALPVEMQDLMIAEADAATPGNHFTVESLDSSHSPFVSQPDRVADILLSGE
jgi:pimeloyl-ACP methyl ester carboxylesterase